MESEGGTYSLQTDTELTQKLTSNTRNPMSTQVSNRLNNNEQSSSGLSARRGSVIRSSARIMDRDDKAFHRSKGRWNIRRIKMPNYWKLYLQDPFHSVVNMRISKVLMLLSFLYISVLLIFGGLYYTVPRETCKTAIFSYYDGFSFSVSVLFTIGFGTNGGDVFFGECAWMQTIITVQSLIGVFLEAIALGVMFQRFARAQARANTIVLSCNACVRRIRGEMYFMIQVCEMRKHQLVEAHVRMYAVRHDIHDGHNYYFQSYPMRIQHPDDDLGGMLLLALPSVVVHRMDAWSPLLRPKAVSSLCSVHHTPSTSYLFPEPVCRQADADSGDRDGTVLAPGVKNHFNQCKCNSKTNSNGTTSDKTNDAGKDQEPLSPERKQLNGLLHNSTIDEMARYWKESQLEIIVLVEGIDAVTSATIQVRHSYRAEDILFDHRFENCVDVDPETGGAVVDFNRFHQTRPVDMECIKVAGAFY